MHRWVAKLNAFKEEQLAEQLAVLQAEQKRSEEDRGHGDYESSLTAQRGGCEDEEEAQSGGYF